MENIQDEIYISPHMRGEVQENNIHIIYILDRSGSMSSIKKETIEGFNRYVESQRQNKNALMTLIQFDDQYEVVFEKRNILDVEPLTEKTFIPRGSTSLYDTVGRAVSEYCSDTKDITLVIIQTDGQSNCDIEQTPETISEIISEKTKSGIEFVYLAANLDAFTSAGTLNIKHGNVMQFYSNTSSVNTTFDNLSAATTRYTKFKSKAAQPPGVSFYETDKSEVLYNASGTMDSFFLDQEQDAK